MCKCNSADGIGRSEWWLFIACTDGISTSQYAGNTLFDLLEEANPESKIVV